MEITKMCLGMFATNTYLLREGDDVILIDPASKAEKLIGMLEGKRLLIFITRLPWIQLCFSVFLLQG